MYHKETLNAYIGYLDAMIKENKRVMKKLDDENSKSFVDGFNYAYELVRKGIEGFFESNERILLMNEARKKILDEMDGDLF